jgi:hypothetical protein
MLHFVYIFICQWIFGLFLPLGTGCSEHRYTNIFETLFSLLMLLPYVVFAYGSCTFYNLTNSAWMFQFLLISVIVVFFCFLKNNSHSSGYDVNLIVVFDIISLMISDAEYPLSVGEVWVPWWSAHMERLCTEQERNLGAWFSSYPFQGVFV